MFVSGLNVGSAHCNQLALQLLVDYLSGCLGGVEDQAKMRKVVRVIVAGNSITNKPVESSIQLEKKKKKVSKCSSVWLAEGLLGTWYRGALFRVLVLFKCLATHSTAYTIHQMLCAVVYSVHVKKL